MHIRWKRGETGILHGRQLVTAPDVGGRSGTKRHIPKRYTKSDDEEITFPSHATNWSMYVYGSFVRSNLPSGVQAVGAVAAKHKELRT
jgi:hypothetical protein